MQRAPDMALRPTPPAAAAKAAKRVCFADHAGQALASFREFRAADEPVVLAVDRLAGAPRGDDGSRAQAADRGGDIRKFLSASFVQPALLPDFATRLRRKGVQLENALARGPQIICSILVVNDAFEKTVFVRLTTDEWRSHRDVPATFAGAAAADVDRFSLTATVPDWIPVGGRILLAVCYRTPSRERWDNNGGANYAIECYATNPLLQRIQLLRVDDAADRPTDWAARVPAEFGTGDERDPFQPSPLARLLVRELPPPLSRHARPLRPCILQTTPA